MNYLISSITKKSEKLIEAVLALHEISNSTNNGAFTLIYNP